MSDDRTSIWYLITALPRGGTERTLVDLVNNIDTGRFDPTVWTVFDRNPLASELDGVSHRTLGVEATTGSGDPYHYRAADPTEYVWAPLRFLRAVRRGGPDILQSFLFFDNVIVRTAGVTSPETTVITGVRAVPNEPNSVKSIADSATIRGSDMIVSNSEAGADLAIERGAPADRVTVIPNGRRLDEYRNASPDGVRPEVGLPDDARIVGSVGRLIERKGHHDLVAAWPQIRSLYPDTHLILVGDGPRRKALRRRVRTMGCSESVHFLGVRDDVPRLLALMDVFVLPSYFEGLPGALQEAMAAGIPIVATDVTGNDELVTHEETGVMVPSDDPAAIGNAIDSLLADPVWAESLGRAASREASERFSLEGMVSAFEELYALDRSPCANEMAEISATDSKSQE